MKETIKDRLKAFVANMREGGIARFSRTDGDLPESSGEVIEVPLIAVNWVSLIREYFTQEDIFGDGWVLPEITPPKIGVQYYLTVRGKCGHLHRTEGHYNIRGKWYDRFSLLMIDPFMGSIVVAYHLIPETYKLDDTEIQNTAIDNMSSSVGNKVTVAEAYVALGTAAAKCPKGMDIAK